MTENRREFLELLAKLPPEKMKVMRDFMYLMAYSSGFLAAYDAIILPDTKTPVWEEAEALVAEWMKKEARGA